MNKNTKILLYALIGVLSLPYHSLCIIMIEAAAGLFGPEVLYGAQVIWFFFCETIYLTGTLFALHIVTGKAVEKSKIPTKRFVYILGISAAACFLLMICRNMIPLHMDEIWFLLFFTIAAIVTSAKLYACGRPLHSIRATLTNRRFWIGFGILFCLAAVQSIISGINYERIMAEMLNNLQPQTNTVTTFFRIQTGVGARLFPSALILLSFRYIATLFAILTSSGILSADLSEQKSSNGDI